MKSLLEIKGLHVAYGKVEAVRGVALEMQPGQIVTVIGPNGAGKTTLLAAAAGLLRSRGSVIYNGIDLHHMDVEERVERGFCLVPERRELFGDMTVTDNLVLGAYARRRRGTSVHQRLQGVYERFPRLAERRRQKAHTLSGGERQMLALASAIVCRPELLLVDELSLGLAPVVVEDLLRRLTEIRRELGITILIVEQSAVVALEIADYGYVMENGRIVLDGTAERLRSHPDIQEFYLGRSSGERRSYRDVKQYRRSRRWYG
jgi:branched-chain amino acid transport system ATP-binding protein